MPPSRLTNAFGAGKASDTSLPSHAEPSRPIIVIGPIAGYHSIVGRVRPGFVPQGSVVARGGR